MRGKIFYIGTILLISIFFFVLYGYSQRSVFVNEPQGISIPLKIHVINSSDGTYTSERNESNIITLIQKTENIWKQAGIHLEIKEIVSTNMESDDIHAVLSNRDPDALILSDGFDVNVLNVFLTSNLDGVNGIAFPTQESIMVADTTTVNDYRAAAHEIGHVLGLGDATEANSLMTQGKNRELLAAEEVSIARENTLLLFSDT